VFCKRVDNWAFGHVPGHLLFTRKNNIIYTEAAKHIITIILAAMISYNEVRILWKGQHFDAFCPYFYCMCAETTIFELVVKILTLPYHVI